MLVWRSINFLYYLLLIKWGKDIKNTLYQMLKEMKIFDIKTPTYSKRYHISTLGSIQKCKGMTLTLGYREPVPQDMCVCEPLILVNTASVLNENLKESFKNDRGGWKMAQWVKELADKCQDLRLIPRTYMAEGEERPSCKLFSGFYTHIHHGLYICTHMSIK